jgi:hypothetical protein
MKIPSCLFLLFIFKISYCQFAFINDKDGFVNVRGSSDSKSHIIDTLRNGHFVWCFDEPQGDWIYVDYKKEEHERTGFIHKSRIKYISSFESISIKQLDHVQVIHKKDSISLIISKGDFIPKNANLTYGFNNDFKYLSKVNGKPIWGTDGNIPKSLYKIIQIQIGNSRITLPKSAIENLFEPNLNYSACYYDKGKDVLYLSGMNSDGAGGYVVLWVIEKRTYRERYITNGF